MRAAQGLFLNTLVWASLLPLLVPGLACAHPSAQGTAGELSFEGSLPVEYAPARMQLLFLKSTTGYPLRLEVSHERILHLFIVGEDLDAFAHLHPEDFPDGMGESAAGTYKFAYAFPGAGRYALVADYTIGGVEALEAVNISVAGTHPLREPVRDLRRTKRFGAYSVSIAAPTVIEAGTPAQIDYHIEREGVPVTDLQMYLGAEMHVFIADENLTDFGHTHPYVPGHGLHAGNMTQRYIGPTVPVRYTFRNPGTYALFAQFRESGQVTTTKFLVEVAPERPAASGGLRVAVACAGAVLLCALGYALSRRRKGRGTQAAGPAVSPPQNH